MIESAFSCAMARMLNFYVTDWTHTPNLEVVDHATFSASVSRRNGLTVHVAVGCADALAHLRDYVALSVSDALAWLVLHELHHADLGHFEILDGIPVLNLVTCGVVNSLTLNSVPCRDWPKVAPCLELQADHDALEMLLNDCSVENWGEIRRQAACIAAAIVLIEKADEEDGVKSCTHPQAATRIFQLLGHVTELVTIPAHAKAKYRGLSTVSIDDMPSEEEKQMFSKEVILPAYWDAVALAKAAGAQGIISDLGVPEDFFADIARAKLGQWDELVTVGAKEWAELKDVNDQVLGLLSIN